MLDIILRQSSFNWDKLMTILLFGILPFFLCSFGIFLICLLSEYQKRKNKENTEYDIMLSKFFSMLTTIAGLMGLYLWIAIDQQQRIINPLTEEKAPLTQYYDVTKDGKTITATRKENIPIVFISKLTVTIIDEDDKSYQVQYENQYGRIPKSDVK